VQANRRARLVAVSASMLGVLVTAYAFALSPTRLDAARSKEVEQLIHELSWASVGMGGGVVPIYFPTGSAAEQLIGRGRGVTIQLVAALGDGGRGVAVHLILSRLWERGGQFGSSTHYLYEGTQITGWEPCVNGLTWRWLRSQGYSVEQSDLDQNTERWVQRLNVRQALHRWLPVPIADLECQQPV